MMTKFWELFEQSVIVQSLLTLIVVGAYAYMSAAGIEISEGFNAITISIVGFWFGSKAGYAQGARAMRATIGHSQNGGE